MRPRHGIARLGDNSGLRIFSFAPIRDVRSRSFGTALSSCFSALDWEQQGVQAGQRRGTSRIVTIIRIKSKATPALV